MTKRGDMMPKVMVRATISEERLRGVSWQRVAVVLRVFIRGMGRQESEKQEVTLGRREGSVEQRQVRRSEDGSRGSRAGDGEEDESDEVGTKSGDVAHERSNSVRQSCWKECVLVWSVNVLQVMVKNT